MMIAAEKKIAVLTSLAEAKISTSLPESRLARRAFCSVRCRNAFGGSARCRKMFSTMITVVSTTGPKSIAPTDSKFADSPRNTKIVIAKNRAKGISLRRSARCGNCRETPTAQRDQHDTEHHVVHHGAGRDVDQILAVINALDPHAGWQNVRIVAGARDHPAAGPPGAQHSNINVGGQTVNFGPQAAIVRGVGLIHSMDQIRDTTIAAVNGVAVRIRDVAVVTAGHQPRL